MPVLIRDMVKRYHLLNRTATVNGQVAWRGGKPGGARFGRVLRRSAA